MAATSRVVSLTTQQNRVPELKFCGNVHLLVSHAFMALTGTTLVENKPEVNEYFCSFCQSTSLNITRVFED